MTHEIDWAGVDVPYFLRAMLPDQPALANARFETTEPGHTGLVQVFFDAGRDPAGPVGRAGVPVYAGPKEEQSLEALGAGLIRAINLGYTWVVPLTRFFHWLLQALYSVVPNYGVAIILLTMLVRLVTAPLTNRQMRSMERMRALAPKLEELKAKFADDKAKQSEEMMKLYRQEGVNPLGGCLPMVLQIPVFIGLFYALQQLDRAAPLSVLRVDHGSLGAGVAVHDSRARDSGARAAAADGRLDGGAAEAHADAGGPGAGEDDADRDAGDDDGDVLSIPVRTRALLDGEQRDRHLPPALDRPPLARGGVEPGCDGTQEVSHVRRDE